MTAQRNGPLSGAATVSPPPPSRRSAPIVPPPSDSNRRSRAVERWSSYLVRRGVEAAGGQPLPRYGDAEWSRLDDRDPRKVAAVVVGAECHRADCDPQVIAERYADELSAEYYVAEQEDAAAFAEVAAKVRGLALVPTQAELARRRGDLAS